MLLVFGLSTQAQESKILSKDAFLAIVRQYHPVAMQAQIQLDRAAAAVLEARGAFDPVISLDLDQKTFNGQQYYSYLNPQLTIPTWYGLELKAGAEEVYGARIDNERTPGKSSYLGVKLAANDLLIDKRRAILRQAQLIQKQSDAERKLAINDLVFEAYIAYLEWTQAYQQYVLFNDIVAIIQNRLRFVQTEFIQGSRPAIDTTETLAQLQSMQQQQLAAEVAWLNSSLSLSTYLWQEDMKPFQWQLNIFPDTSIFSPSTRNIDAGILLKLSTSDLSIHPKLDALRNKLAVQETERRLKMQSFLPKLSVNANALNKGYQAPSEVTTPFLQNNYKLGLDFAWPLLLRGARGAYRNTQLKINDIQWEQANTLVALDRKLKSYINDVQSLQSQLAQFEAAFENYNKLYQGERLRFTVGESTLFLLNSRENKVLEARQKLIDLQFKWHKSLAGAIWSAAGFVSPI